MSAMTVGELIDALAQMPADAQVVFNDHRTLAGILATQLIQKGPLANSVVLMPGYYQNGEHA